MDCDIQNNQGWGEYYSLGRKKTYHRREQEVCLLLELSAPAEQAFSENNENEKFIIREVENSFKGQVHSSVYAHQLHYFFPIYY